MPAYLNLDLLENPYGKRVGGGYDTVRVGPGGGRLHVKGPDGGALCMERRTQTDLRASTGRVVDCYRCIKIMAMNSNAPYISRSLTTAKGDKKPHLMIPGGRQGQLVADKKASPSGMSGVPTFKRGPKNHPTQPWMTKRIAMAKTYEERLRDEGVALPPYFLPQTFEEMEIAQESSYYESPGAIAAVAAAGRRVSREAAAARRADRAAAAAAAAKQVANPYRGRRNPSGGGSKAMSGRRYAQNTVRALRGLLGPYVLLDGSVTDAVRPAGSMVADMDIFTMDGENGLFEMYLGENARVKITGPGGSTVVPLVGDVNTDAQNINAAVQSRLLSVRRIANGRRSR
jgi:hypothetical protein